MSSIIIRFFNSIFQVVERNIFILHISITVKDWNINFLVSLLINTTKMLITRTFVNVCNTMSVASLSGKMIKPRPQILFPQLSITKNKVIEIKRSCATGSSTEPQDLVVDHLEGENSGVVVFGLNRPKVKYFFYSFQLSN